MDPEAVICLMIFIIGIAIGTMIGFSFAPDQAKEVCFNNCKENIDKVCVNGVYYYKYKNNLVPAYKNELGNVKLEVCGE